jgi:hypothetical protein
MQTHLILECMHMIVSALNDILVQPLDLKEDKKTVIQ